MTKKERNELESRKKELEKSINLKLIRALGFDISSNGNVCDQDTFSPIRFKHKYLKYADIDQNLPFHNNDIVFDPLNNFKLLTSLFDIHLKYCQQCGMNIYTHYPEETILGDIKCTSICIMTDMRKYMTEYYPNVVCAYADAILHLDPYGFSEGQIEDIEELRQWGNLNEYLLQ